MKLLNKKQVVDSKEIENARLINRGKKLAGLLDGMQKKYEDKQREYEEMIEKMEEKLNKRIFELQKDITALENKKSNLEKDA